ncbi:MAG: hypothetical protein ACYDFU_03500 [Nitrospirota bacterium]
MADRLTRSQLVIFWLEDAARYSEEYFDKWLKDISKFSKQELTDIIHEIGPESGEMFLGKFKKIKPNCPK